MLAETAYAKVNLALHVRRRRDDGYHEIETLFAFAADGDALTAEPAERLTLHVTGPFAAGLGGDNDLVMRAAKAFDAGVGRGARIMLDKRLPVAAGLGGGSADAAATLRLLSRLWSLDVPLLPIAATLGADMPACLASVTARGDGLGDRLAPLLAPEITARPMLLVNPGVVMPTGPVFAGWDGVDRGALPDGEPLAVALGARNDLEPAAIAIAPPVATLLALLRAQPGIRLARMSGSGATCFALFADAAARTAARIEVERRVPGCWCLETALR